MARGYSKNRRGMAKQKIEKVCVSDKRGDRETSDY